VYTSYRTGMWRHLANRKKNNEQPTSWVLTAIDPIEHHAKICINNKNCRAHKQLVLSAWTLYRLKAESFGYFFAADSMGLSSFKFPWWAPKDPAFVHLSAVRLFKVIQGRWFYRQSEGLMGLPTGDLVTLTLSRTVSEIRRLIAWKSLFVLTP